MLNPSLSRTSSVFISIDSAVLCLLWSLIPLMHSIRLLRILVLFSWRWKEHQNCSDNLHICWVPEFGSLFSDNGSNFRYKSPPSCMHADDGKWLWMAAIEAESKHLSITPWCVGRWWCICLFRQEFNKTFATWDPISWCSALSFPERRKVFKVGMLVGKTIRIDRRHAWIDRRHAWSHL